MTYYRNIDELATDAADAELATASQSERTESGLARPTGHPSMQPTST